MDTIETIVRHMEMKEFRRYFSDEYRKMVRDSETDPGEVNLRMVGKWLNEFTPDTIHLWEYHKTYVIRKCRWDASQWDPAEFMRVTRPDLKLFVPAKRRAVSVDSLRRKYGSRGERRFKPKLLD